MYIDTQEPAICENTKCDDYKSWELYDFVDVKMDNAGYYYICRTCGERIRVK